MSGFVFHSHFSLPAVSAFYPRFEKKKKKQPMLWVWIFISLSNHILLHKTPHQATGRLYMQSTVPILLSNHVNQQIYVGRKEP